jgi:hypothetical protein
MEFQNGDSYISYWKQGNLNSFCIYIYIYIYIYLKMDRSMLVFLEEAFHTGREFFIIVMELIIGDILKIDQ